MDKLPIGNDPVLVRMGVLYCVVCALKTDTTDRIEQFANTIYPTEISSRWECKAGGQPNTQCDEHPDRQHWILNC